MVLTKIDVQKYYHTHTRTRTHTCNAAEKAETWSTVSFVAVGKPFPWEGWDWDCHGDGLVELPSSGLHGNDGAEGCSVTEDFLHSLVGYWLGLGKKRQRRISEVSFLCVPTFVGAYLCVLLIASPLASTTVVTPTYNSPAVQLWSFWLKLPLGRKLEPMGRSGCTESRPLVPSDWSPAWFETLQRSTVGSPWWWCDRFSSSPAPQDCPFLQGRKIHKLNQSHVNHFFSKPTETARFIVRLAPDLNQNFFLVWIYCRYRNYLYFTCFNYVN